MHTALDDKLSYMGRLLAALALAVLMAPAIAGQDSSGRRDSFELFNACRPMGLVVENLHDDAADIGLTKESLQAAAESRLRAARLYTEDMVTAGFTYLWLSVTVTGRAFNITLGYNKWVTDEFGHTSRAQTWVTGGTGTHGSDAGYVVSSLSRYLDTFLAAYLRANEEACGYPAGRP